MKGTKLPQIAAIGAGQWGMVSTAQATAAGADARTLARLAAIGELERLAHGIYRLAGSPPGPHDDLRAAWIGLDPRRTAAERIAAGPTEIVSHRSAAVLHALGDLDADVLEFTTSVRRQPRRTDIRIHRGTIGEQDWTLVDGLPITTALRTVHDLADARIDRGHLAGVVRDVLLQHGVSVGQAASVLASAARAYGVTTGDGYRLVDLLLSEAGIPQSTLDIALRASPDARARMTSGPEFERAVQNAVRARIGHTFADLTASLNSTDDTRAAIQQWLNLSTADRPGDADDDC
ncbi:MAG: hypothetical protein QOE51_1725 [Actinoplanes sp.]|jgi:hypothetical protein|nr:hypothetical protein [Actinoplanes sp.]